MKWDDIKENGIFVGGHRKNGTTLLIAMLDGHPDLFVYPYETHFWYGFYPVYAEGNYLFEQKKQRVKDFVFFSLKQTIKKWMRLEEKDLKISYEELNKIFDERVTNSNKQTKDFFDAIIYSEEKSYLIKTTIPTKCGLRNVQVQIFLSMRYLKCTKTQNSFIFLEIHGIIGL